MLNCMPFALDMDIYLLARWVRIKWRVRDLECSSLIRKSRPSMLMLFLTDLHLRGQRYQCPNMIRKREDELISILYVKSLDEDVTEDLIHDKFSEYGNCNVFIIMDSERKSIGFASVLFESHEDAKKAMEALNGALIASKRLSIGTNLEHFNHDVHLYRKWNKLKDSYLYVDHLAKSIDDRDLKEIFGAFGEVTLIWVKNICYSQRHTEI